MKTSLLHLGGYLGQWTRMAIGLVLPPECAFCAKSLDSVELHPQLCSECRSLFTHQGPACQRCGSIWKPGLGDAPGFQCPECAQEDFAFDRVLSLGVYTGDLSDAVLQMKYEAGQSLAFALGRHLGELIKNKDCADSFDLVTCATKYWSKRLFTGINSPEVIMQGIAQRTDLPHAADLLVCRRRISKQSSLSPARRRQNVRNAWDVSENYNISGARILLVDDILTTGATTHAMSQALKRAGANQVTVAVVGRAQK